MSSWIILSALAGIFSNVSNFFSRYLLKENEDVVIYSWFFESSRFIVFLCFSFFDFSLKLPAGSIYFLVALGILEYISNYYYMKMHAQTQLSISAVVSRTRLVWVPLIAYFILGEHFPVFVYGGIIILFAGLVIASSPHKIILDTGLRYAYSSSFLIAVTIVMMGAASSWVSSSVLLVFLTAPTFIIVPLICRKQYKRFTAFFKRNLGVKCIAALFNIASIYLFALALKNGPVSIISAIYNGMLVIAVIAGIVFLKERQDVKRKLIGSAIATAGVVLLSWK